MCCATLPPGGRCTGMVTRTADFLAKLGILRDTAFLSA
jgi:hypothetical protein